MKSNKNVSAVILRTIKKQIWLTVGIVCAVIGAIATALLPPWILGIIIDTLIAGNKVSFALISAYFAFTVLSGLAESVREGFLTVFGQKITHALRSCLMEKQINLPTDIITKQDPGTIVSRFVGDVDTVENLFTSGIVSMFADACKIISILCVIWLRNKGLALVLLAILPFLFLFTRVVQKNMLQAQIANRKAVGRASKYVPETLHNIRTIHCLKKETYMEKRYAQAINESFRAVERTNFFDAVYSPVILILNAIVVAVVMLFSASGNKTVLALFGMSAGTAVAVINYISQIFSPVENLGMEIQTIQSAIAGVHRINEFLCQKEREKTKPTEIAEDNSYKPNSSFINFSDVTFAYNDDANKNVLKNMSFQVCEGEHVTLSGRTGAGKSTIFKLLLGLYEPQHGSVTILGKPASLIRDEDKRKIYGYVEQTFHIVPGTVKDQITLYDTSITMNDVRKAAEIVGLNNVIMNLEHGYDTKCSPEIFSQGQWQLLSIARAAVTNPKLLLLDEITANLDTQTESEVLRALERVSKGRTVISISHRVNAKTGRIIHIS